MWGLRGWVGLAVVLAAPGVGHAAAVGPKAGEVLTVRPDGAADGGLAVGSLGKEDTVVTDQVSGKPCWRLAIAEHVCYLRCAADPGFWRQDGGPVQVTVEYLDRGKGTLAVKYRGRGVRPGADEPQSEPVRKTGSGEWRRAVFSIPDADLKPNQPWGFSITANNWLPGDDDDWIASVELRLGGLTVGPDDPVAAADPEQPFELTVSVVPGPSLPVKAKDQLHLTASCGFVESPAVINDGEAKVYYVPPKEPGVAVVTATCGAAAARWVIPILPGKGPLEQRRIRLTEFGGLDGWKVAQVDARATAKVTTFPPVDGDGQGVAISYRYEPNKSGARAVLQRDLPLPGLPTGVHVNVRGDGAGNSLWVLFRDATHQLFYVPLGPVTGTTWQPRTEQFARLRRFSGGANDGNWHLPASCYELRVQATGGREHRDEGEVVLDWLDVTVLATKSAWEAWDAAAKKP